MNDIRKLLEARLISLDSLNDWIELRNSVWIKLDNSLASDKVSLFWWFQDHIYFCYIEEYPEITKKAIKSFFEKYQLIGDARYLVMLIQRYWNNKKPYIIWIDLWNKTTPKITKFSIDTKWTYNLESDKLIYKNRTLVEQFVWLIDDIWEWERPLKVRYLKKFFEKQKLTQEFYSIYKNELFEKIKKDLLWRFWKKEEEAINNFILVNLNRLLFIHFLDKKWSVFKNYDKQRYWSYISYLFHDVYVKRLHTEEPFYNIVLQPLFFDVLNKPNSKRWFKNNILEKEFWYLPYLNWWLFKQSKYEKTWFFIDNAFIKLFILRIIDAFNFTIKEDTPFEVKVSVDPELLWYIFENLIQDYDKEQAKDDEWKGKKSKNKKDTERDNDWVFYTPKIEVDFMCRQVLIEYLCKKPELKHLKNSLYELFYPEKWWSDDQKYWSFSDREIWTIFYNFEKLKVVDPACWSWAFLVWMMQVILDAENTLLESNIEIIKRSNNEKLKEYLRKKLNIFQRKKQLIKNSLYGVDIKPWAVEIAKLRLWLSMIIDVKEEAFTSENAKNEPLLPSFWFHIVQWDSLVNRVWDILVPVDVAINSTWDTKVTEKINELITLKNKYYDNEPIEKGNEWLVSTNTSNEEYIKQKEILFYETLLSNKIRWFKWEITKLENKKTFKSNTSTLFWSSELWWTKFEPVNLKKIEKEIDEYNQQIDSLNKQLYEIKNSWSVPFSRWIDFADVFIEKWWFDIVVWNPPYVSYKKISDSTWKIDTESYKNYLKESIINEYRKNLFVLDWKSDLYIYFYYRSLSLLNELWVMAFITSNMWLDTQYWFWFQSFLCRCFSWSNIKIFDSWKQTFQSADLNSSIIFIPKVSKESEFTDSVTFCMFKNSYDDSVYSNHFQEIENIWFDKKDNENFILQKISWEELYKMWVEDSDTLIWWKYTWKKWSSEFFREKWKMDLLLDKCMDKLIQIKNIEYLELSTWIKEWWFKEFIKKESNLPNLKILYNVKNHNEVRIEDYDGVVDSPKHVEKYKNKTPNLLMISARWRTHKLHYNPNLYTFSWNYLWMNVTDGNKLKDILLLFNSTFYMLVTELWARNKWIWWAAIVMNKMDLLEIFVPNPDLFDFDQSLFDDFCNYSLQTIFEEIWIDENKDIRLQTPSPRELRKKIDDIVFEVLWLNNDERNEIYRTMAELLKTRIEKAKNK